MAASSFVWEYNDIAKNLAEFTPKMRANAAVIVDREADLATANMKSNAPWTDRTGNARSTLATDVKHRADADEMILHGGMPYQVYLETMQAGRFAAIVPETRHRGPHVMAQMTQLFSMMRSK